jgi:hypothetical protein
MSGLRNEFDAGIEHHENITSDEFSKVNQIVSFAKAKALQAQEKVIRQKTMMYEMMVEGRRHRAELNAKENYVRWE